MVRCLLIVLGLCCALQARADSSQFTVIPYRYQKIFHQANRDVRRLIHRLPRQRSPQYLNRLVQISARYLVAQHIPYMYVGAEGEGSWCGAKLSRRGCSHIQQDLVYRTDNMDCFTLVQFVLALVDAHSLSAFQQHIVQVDYGAASLFGQPSNVVAYYNRNNFVSADFNPVNQRRGWIRDVSGQGIFKRYLKSTSAVIDHRQWFAKKAKAQQVKTNVRVLRASNGARMVKRLRAHYASFYKPENVSITYIPKRVLVLKRHQSYVANPKMINQIPVPSVVEIVRNVKKWKDRGVNIQKLIGSGINVSHAGLLYVEHFKNKQIIDQRITCKKHWFSGVTCLVRPVRCQKRHGCKEIMMLAATNAYPSRFLWSENKKTHHYYCTAPDNLPRHAKRLTTCNRVMAMPFGDYITRKEYGQFIYLNAASILGFNVEKML
jgi:hypothetical protein